MDSNDIMRISQVAQVKYDDVVTYLPISRTKQVSKLQHATNQLKMTTIHLEIISQIDR